MRWFSKKRKKAPEPASGAGRSDDLAQRLRDVKQARAMVEGDAALQEAFRQVLGDEPAPPPPSPDLDEVKARVSSGGLSYLISPPTGFSDVAPDAARLHTEGAMGALTGDDAACLEKFTQALALAREVGHEPAQVRLLYNAGLAHYKLGDPTRAIEVLGEGRDLARRAHGQLAKEARKLQRSQEEILLDEPRVELLGVPETEDDVLLMFLEALATVHEAAGRPIEAADCRREAERLRREAT